MECVQSSLGGEVGAEDELNKPRWKTVMRVLTQAEGGVGGGPSLWTNVVAYEDGDVAVLAWWVGNEGVYGGGCV